jgi:hypothetical protein
MKGSISCILRASLVSCFIAISSFAALPADKTSFTPKEVTFMSGIRMAFAQNLNWERIYFYERLANAPDADKTRQRLLTCQDVISNALREYYGDDIANQLDALLKQNVQSLDDYANIVRSGAGDKTPIVSALYDNANAVTSLLGMQNMFINKDALSASLKQYDDMLAAEINMQYPNIGSVDPATFDTTFSQAMSLADIISISTMKQFSAKFW